MECVSPQHRTHHCKEGLRWRLHSRAKRHQDHGLLLVLVLLLMASVVREWRLQPMQQVGRNTACRDGSHWPNLPHSSESATSGSRSLASPDSTRLAHTRCTNGEIGRGYSRPKNVLVMIGRSCHTSDTNVMGCRPCAVRNYTQTHAPPSLSIIEPRPRRVAFARAAYRVVASRQVPIEEEPHGLEQAVRQASEHSHVSVIARQHERHVVDVDRERIAAHESKVADHHRDVELLGQIEPMHRRVVDHQHVGYGAGILLPHLRHVPPQRLRLPVEGRDAVVALLHARAIPSTFALRWSARDERTSGICSAM